MWLIWLAGKYISARGHQHKFSSLCLAVLGIATGTAALIAISTGMKGMQQPLADGIDEVTAYHLQIELDSFRASNIAAQALIREDSVRNITLYQEAPMLLSPKVGEPIVCIVRAVDPQSFMADIGRQNVMRNWSPIQEDDLKNPSHMWIGNGLAYQNALIKGDPVYLLSITDVQQGVQPTQMPFQVSSTYTTGHPIIENKYIFIGLTTENAKLFYPDSFYLGVKLKKRSQARALKEKTIQILQTLQEKQKVGKFLVQTGREANESFFVALQIEKAFLHILVSLIFLLVAFQIFQSTRRTVFIRIPELMLLVSLGASSKKLRYIFLIEGIFTGVLGSLLGSILGTILCHHINSILDFISLTLFNIPSHFIRISSKIDQQDFNIIIFSALFCCAAAGWFASRKLLQANPIEILRNE